MYSRPSCSIWRTPPSRKMAYLLLSGAAGAEEEEAARQAGGVRPVREAQAEGRHVRGLRLVL